MKRDSDKNTNPNINYVNCGDADEAEEQTDQMFLAVSFYISSHVKRHHTHTKQMARVTLMYKQMMRGGMMDVTHRDFRLIIQCMVYFSKHFASYSAHLASILSPHEPVDLSHDDTVKKMTGLAKYLLSGDFYETMTKSHQKKFNKLRKQNAPVAELLRL